jgi:hypothetical protein
MVNIYEKHGSTYTKHMVNIYETHGLHIRKTWSTIVKPLVKHVQKHGTTRQTSGIHRQPLITNRQTTCNNRKHMVEHCQKQW